MALLEAMSYGVPIISTDVGAAAPTIGNEVAGLIVPPLNPRALADAMERLLTDETLRRKLGANARQRVECEFSVGKVAERLTQFYSMTLHEKQTRQESASP